MIPDFLLRLADDNLQLAPAGTSVTNVLKLTPSLSIQPLLTAFSNIGAGKPLFMRVALSRFPTPAPAGNDSVTIQLRGSESPVQFAPFTSVTASAATDELTFGAAHGLLVGTPVVLHGTAAPGGTTLATTYFAIPTGTLTIKLASTRANALAGTPIDLTTAGTAVTIRQKTSVLALALDGDRDPELAGSQTNPVQMNTFVLSGSATNFALGASPRVWSTPIPSMPGVIFAPGSIGAGSPGVRYLTGALLFNVGAVAITDFRITMDITDVADDSKMFYPSGIVPGIS